MSKLKVITLFSGIGAQEAGLKRLGVDFEMVGMCEIDKYAIKSYEGINGPTHNYGDISKIDRLDYADLLVYRSILSANGSNLSENTIKVKLYYIALKTLKMPLKRLYLRAT